jgi:hypothetical protein
MEWTIPIQSFDTSKVRIGPLGRGAKPLVPLAYTEGDFRFTGVSLLLPLLPVKSYEPATGKLVLALSSSPVAVAKLQAFQDTLLAVVKAQQGSWFQLTKTRGIEELRDLYQPMVENGHLHLYCPLGAAAGGAHAHELQVYTTSGGWVRSSSLSPAAAATSVLAPGRSVRIALRIQGISFHQHPISGMWTGKFRLQHRILTILCAEG